MKARTPIVERVYQPDEDATVRALTFLLRNENGAVVRAAPDDVRKIKDAHTATPRVPR
jgi:hypothetical protein